MLHLLAFLAVAASCHGTESDNITSLPFYTAESSTQDGGNIIGGDVAEPGSTPWLVSIRDAHYTPPVHFCGGTILTHYWILTAASCVIGYGITGIKVVLGDYDREIDEGYERTRIPLFWMIHPNYDYYTKPAYDAALVFVAYFPYGERIQPAHLLPSPYQYAGYHYQSIPKESGQSRHCHPQQPKWDLEGADGLIAGWGRISDDDQFSNLVLEANLTILSNGVCAGAYPGYEMESLMCAANVTYGGVDACAGDSGGGLINKDGYILGIYTYEEPCASEDYPGLYVNISMIQDWLCLFIDTGGDIRQKML